MSDTSSILGLPYIQPAQAQKHVTHNEAIRSLDALVQLSVRDRDLTSPPVGPENGDRYLVAPGGTGLWAGQDDSVALFENGSWSFFAPQNGWHLIVEDEDILLIWNGTAWTAPAVDSAALQNLPQIGVNGAADTNNRLTVAANGTLLTHDGADHRVTVNKAASTDTNSLLFQTNWSGRAEMGTTGSDTFEIKVSDDGTAWKSAAQFDAQTGRATFPSGARTRGRIDLGGRWYCYSDNRWITHNPAYGIQSENCSSSGGTAAEPAVSWSDLGTFVSQGTQLNDLTLVYRANSTQVTGFDLRLYFQTGPWGAGFNSDANATLTPLISQDGLSIAAGYNKTTIDLSGFTPNADGFMILFLRPLGTITATRYIYTAITLDYLSES